MKIISPSATIIEAELEKLSLPERIEQCGRICYKSEGKIIIEERHEYKDWVMGSAKPFCQKVIERGHNSVLEMATVSIYIRADNSHIVDFISLFTLIEEMKFLEITITSEDSLIVTGSIRTFRDLHENKQAFDASCIIRSCYRKVDFLDGHPMYSRSIIPKDILAELRCLAVFEEKDWKSVMADSAEVYSKHKHVAVKFIVNRAISHELVRHRPCSFLQESQRYVNMKDGVTFIKPVPGSTHGKDYVDDEWEGAMIAAERSYLTRLNSGASPQEARLVLPNSTKTELIIYTTLDEWKHIFAQRDSRAADPAMREVMSPLHEEFKKEWPGIFGVSKEKNQKEKNEQECISKSH